jgi:hypothetical protein
MTTQLPYDAAYPQQPAPPAYPTAPPWAAPPSPPDRPPAPPDGFGAPDLQHGQLLVPYPEEMHNAARPKPPSWWPVVGWTFFFGIFGAVSASRRADQARRGRNSVTPYWLAWGCTLAASVVAAGIVVAVGLPGYLDYREGAVTKVVQDRIVTDGRLAESASVTASAATCEPVGPRDTAGQRRYDCVLTLDDGRTGTLTVTADSDGAWTAVPGK